MRLVLAAIIMGAIVAASIRIAAEKLYALLTRDTWEPDDVEDAVDPHA